MHRDAMSTPEAGGEKPDSPNSSQQLQDPQTYDQEPQELQRPQTRRPIRGAHQQLASFAGPDAQISIRCSTQNI